ncbi:MAG: hypothetical protein ACP6KW_09630 [Candidatus Thorarchaeota archaeon]
MVLLGDSSEVDWVQDVSIIDSWKVWQQHFRTMAFGVLIFGFYAVFLLIICSLSPSYMSVILLLASQILIGLPATRAFFDLGVAARESVSFYGFPSVDSKEIREERVSRGVVPLLFESLSLHAQKLDAKSPDDYSDISWFIILVWSVLSAGLYALGMTVPWFCVISDLVLILACVMSYASGFRMRAEVCLEDQLEQIEFLVQSRLTAVEETLGTRDCDIILLLHRRRRREYFSDIVVETLLAPETRLEYHAGLPAMESERIIVEASRESIRDLKECLTGLDVFKSGEWWVEEIKTQSAFVLRILNRSTSVDISNPTSFMVSPDSMEESARILKGVLRTTLLELT